MAETTGIEWTEATWNPWYGCIKVSPGCKNCYMYREMKRYGRDPFTVVRSKTKFRDPLKWVTSTEQAPPKFCFTCSWSDFFIEQADAWRPEAWAIIKQTPQITYQILTKRPELVRDRLPQDWGTGYPNVWLGVSAENQQYADLRIPQLLQIPAAVRWVSAGPLLGPIELNSNWLPSHISPPIFSKRQSGFHDGPNGGIHWVVAEGETGLGSRPMHPDWVRALRDQCEAAGVPFFFKQWGDWAPGEMVPDQRSYPAMNYFDGQWKGCSDDWATEKDGGPILYRVGKHVAGRVLDGVEHSAYPQIAERVSA